MSTLLKLASCKSLRTASRLNGQRAAKKITPARRTPAATNAALSMNFRDLGDDIGMSSRGMRQLFEPKVFEANNCIRVVSVFCETTPATRNACGRANLDVAGFRSFLRFLS